MFGHYKQGLPVARDPQQIAGSNLLAWWDANSSTASDGGRGPWSSVVGGQNINTFGAGDEAPLYRSKSFYGRPAFEFHTELSGSINRNMSRTSLGGSGWNSATSWTVASVLRVNTRPPSYSQLGLWIEIQDALATGYTRIGFGGTAEDPTQAVVDLPGVIGGDRTFTFHRPMKSAAILVSADDATKTLTTRITPLTDGGTLGQTGQDAYTGLLIPTATIALFSDNAPLDHSCLFPELICIDRETTIGEQDELLSYLWNKWQERPES